MCGSQKFQMMWIHSLFIHLETVYPCSVWSDHCLVIINTVGMQKFEKFLQILLYLCCWVVFQHIMIFRMHGMEYCQLILHILFQMLSYWLLRHTKLLLIATNKYWSINISCYQCIYDTILFIIDGIKYISKTASGTARVSFNLSLIDVITSRFIVFNSIKIIIPLLQLVIMIVLHGTIIFFNWYGMWSCILGCSIT